MACGLYASGTGFGMLVMAPITEVLLSLYSVHGTLLIFSGIALNGTVLGLLIFYSLPRNNDKTTSGTSETTETELYDANSLNEETREYGNSEKEILLKIKTVQEKDRKDQDMKKNVSNYKGVEHRSTPGLNAHFSLSCQELT